MYLFQIMSAIQSVFQSPTLKIDQNKLRFSKIRLYKMSRNKAELICLMFDAQRSEAQLVFLFLGVQSN